MRPDNDEEEATRRRDNDDPAKSLHRSRQSLRDKDTMLTRKKDTSQENGENKPRGLLTYSVRSSSTLHLLWCTRSTQKEKLNSVVATNMVSSTTGPSS
jgi:hypothetical protein